MGLSWVDLAIASVVILSMITGLLRGFVKECIALCVWSLAFWVAFHYGSMLDPWLSPYIHDKTLRTGIEFLIILFSSLLLGGIVNALIGFFMSRSGLSGTDRLLGMGFGFVRGVLIAAVIFLGIRMTGLSISEYTDHSMLYTQLLPVVDWLHGYVPQFVQQVKVYDKTGGAVIDIAHEA